MIPRIMAAIVVLCTVCMPPSTYAEPLSGPDRDPHIETYTQLSLTCPLPIFVDCDFDGIYNTFADFEEAGGGASLPEGCTITSFTHVGDQGTSQNGCTTVYSREYSIIASCNMTFSCFQDVTETDTDDPLITNGPADITIQNDNSAGPCLVAYTVPEVMAIDGCSSSPTITNDAPTVFPIGSTTVTYTATDACGNEGTHTFQVIVEDDGAFALTCPPTITLTDACDASDATPYVDLAAFEAAGGSVTNDCDGAGMYTLSEISTSAGTGTCPITYERVYRVTDANGTTADCTQLIIVSEGTPPSFSVPVDITVDCDQVTDLSITGSPSNIMDNCQGASSSSFVDSDTIIAQDACAGEFTFTRTWTVTDACDNSSSLVQMISTEDNTPPTAICVDTATVYLDELGDAILVPSDLDNGSFDDCGDITLMGDMTFVSCNQISAPIPAQLFVEDQCGNRDTCDLVVQLLDTMAVNLISPPNDTVQCIADVDLPFSSYEQYNLQGDGDVEDNCITSTTFELLAADTTGVCPISIRRLYQYTDNSGNSDTASHLILIIDTIAPMITMCPADIVISEIEICDTLITLPLPLFTDNCDAVTITNDYTNNADTLATFEGGMTRVTFTVSDACGNSDTCSINITVAAEPRITFPPLSAITSLSDLPDYGTYLEFEMAGGSVNEFCMFDFDTFDYDPDVQLSDDGCAALFTQTVMIEDMMGNPFEASTEAELIDSVAPVLSGCQTQYLMLMPTTCDLDTMITEPTATDNFGVDTTYYTIGDFVQDTAIVVFYAADACGNVDSCIFDLVIRDTTSPDIMISDTILVCGDGSLPGTADIDSFLMMPGAMIEDCRIDSMTLTFTDVVVSSSMTERTYTIKDLAGNTGTVMHLITVDTTGPIITNPNDTTVMCISHVAGVDTFESVQDVVDAGGVIGGNCELEILMILSEDEINDSLIIRTYEAIDSLGNVAVITHNILIDDTTPPVINGLADITIECTISPDSLEVVGDLSLAAVNDNCGTIDTIYYSDTSFGGSCPVVDSIQRVWIVEDIDGNMTRDTQTIILLDTKAPVFLSSPTALDDIECDDVLPDFESLMAMDSCSVVSVDTNVIRSPGSVCLGYNIMYQWVATDACGNESMESVSFQILPETRRPKLIDINNQTLSSAADTCGFSMTSIPEPIFAAGCSDIILSHDYTEEYLPVGTTMITWTASSCDNDTMVVQTVEILDDVPPVVVCHDINLSLGGDGTALVQADSLVVMIVDNCDHYFANDILVRRVDGPSECANGGGFAESVTFCCSDVGTTVLVEVQVEDDSGNTNTCMSEVVVSNNASVNLQQGLTPEIYISCEYLFDMTDLSVFGTFVDDQVDQNSTVIEGATITDGVYVNTCDMTTVTESSQVLSGLCGQDTVVRVFTFTGPSETISYQQRIIRRDLTPFNASGADIEWPAAYEWMGCVDAIPDTSEAGAPVILNADFCSLVGVTYTDQLFNFPLTSCPFVRRKWKVIDWCQFDPTSTGNAGLWEHTQVIYVNNDVAPTILSACTDQLLCAQGDGCETTFNYTIDAEDDCMVDAQNLYYQYRIDIDNDDNPANDITGTTRSISTSVPDGEHEVIWLVEDRCGNIAECSFMITAKECKSPTAVCLDGISINIANGGSVELWASDINQSSSDNCTTQDDLQLSFSADPANTVLVFTCEDVGDQPVELWVTDQAGNQSFCSTSVDIQDNQGSCGNMLVGPFTGQIITEGEAAIPNAIVSIQGAEMDETYATEQNGMYAFEGLDAANEYEITVTRDINHIEGVTTLDLVLIQRHILGIEPLNSPYKLMAADVNSSESINASDLLELRKLILGVTEEFKDNTSWRFVSQNEEMDDLEHPWPFMEDLTLDNGSLDDVVSDFVGVKIGDVSNSTSGLVGSLSSEIRSDQTLMLYADDQLIKRDDQLYIDIVNMESRSLEAMQMTISWDVGVLGLVDVIPVGLAIEDAQVNMDQATDGVITIAWHSATSQVVSAGTPLFQLIMEGNDKAMLSDKLHVTSDVTDAIAYDHNHRGHDIELTYGRSDQMEITMFQNKPNPFLEETVVDFSLPESMEVTFKVFSNSGKLIYTKTANYSQGHNTLVLRDQLGDHSGILFLKMESSEFSEVKRMIRIR